MKRRVVALALALPFLVPPAARADRYCQLRARPVASVLILHAGAWTGGSAGQTGDLCVELALQGYRARSLDYPLGTVPGSIEYARAAAAEEARSGGPVYALGVSAGGTIAEYLAVRGYLDGAVAVAPVSDLVDWPGLGPGYWEGLGMTVPMRHRWSPYENIRRPSRLEIIHSTRDEAVPYEQSTRMVRRCGSACELVTLQYGGPHPMSLAWAGPASLRWFLARVARPERATPAPDATPHAAGPRVPGRWVRVAARAFPRHCRPVHLSFRRLPRSEGARASRASCTVILSLRLLRRPGWVGCTTLVQAYGHLTARWHRRHSRDPGSVMYRRIVRPYRGRRSRC